MNIKNAEELEKVILELEKRAVVQENELRAALDATKDSLKPMNLIKNTISTVTHTSEIRNNAIKAAAGVGLGLLLKNTFIGKSVPILKSLIGNAVETGVRESIADTTSKAKAIGTAIINQLFRKRKKQYVM